MERRAFIRETAARVGGLGLGSLAVGSLVAGCSEKEPGSAPSAQTKKRLRWRLVSSFPRSIETIYGAADRLSARVESLTDGQFSIKAYPAGEIVPALEVMEAVEQGTAEIGHTASYYYSGKDDALVFDCAVPFGLTARQHSAWLLEAGGLDLMRTLFGKFGIRNLPGGNTGVQMGGWFRNPVRSLADLKGLKMRIPGMGGKVMDALGVTVQLLGGGEIYPALERGTIDATEWVGPYDDMKLGFYKVAKHYHYPGWWEPGPALSFYVNQKSWDSLPQQYQSALEAASREAALGMMAEYDAKNPPALKQLLTKGVELVPFPDDVMHAARDVTEQKITALADGNAGFRKIYDHWRAFQVESNRWFGTAEKQYGDFVYGE